MVGEAVANISADFEGLHALNESGTQEMAQIAKEIGALILCGWPADRSSIGSLGGGL